MRHVYAETRFRQRTWEVPSYGSSLARVITLRRAGREQRRVTPGQVSVVCLAPVPRRALVGRGGDVVDALARCGRGDGVGKSKVVADVRRGGGVVAFPERDARISSDHSVVEYDHRDAELWCRPFGCEFSKVISAHVEAEAFVFVFACIDFYVFNAFELQFSFTIEQGEF